MAQALRTPPPQQAPAVPARPRAPLPRDVNATAEETLIATLGDWRFVGLAGMPLVSRKAAGVADAKRRASSPTWRVFVRVWSYPWISMPARWAACGTRHSRRLSRRLPPEPAGRHSDA